MNKITIQLVWIRFRKHRFFFCRNVKSKASKGYEENYFFVRRSEGIFYNELETRVRLTKRRLKAGQQPSNSKLVVKHRPLNKNEHKMQR